MRLRRPLFGLFLALAGLGCAKWAFPGSVPGDARLLAVLLLVEAATTLIVSLSCRLPLQNILLASVTIGLVGTIGNAVGQFGGSPPIHIAGRQGVGVSLLSPLLWIVAVLSSRSLAQALLRPWRQIAAYGYWRLAATVVLVVLVFVPVDLFASAAYPAAGRLATDYAVAHCLAPGVVALRALTAVVALLLATPSLIDKRPV